MAQTEAVCAGFLSAAQCVVSLSKNVGRAKKIKGIKRFEDR
jgi:hypothetical protein